MSDIIAASAPTAAVAGRSAAATAARTAIFALGLFAAMVAGSTLAGALVPSVGEALAGRQPEGAASVAVAVTALLQALVLAPVAARARPGRWRVALGIGAAYWLITPLLMQIESAVFLAPVLPDGFLLSVGISESVVAATAGALAAALFGRRAEEAAAPRHFALLDARVPVHGWGARLMAICAIYIVLYFLAGAFIALRDPELQAFYDQIGMPSLGIILAVQVLRGVLWAVAGALVLGVLDAGRRTAAVLVGLVFALPVTLLLIPNPIMPPEVRSTHFVEVASSNFLFGWATAGILTRRARGRP
jgi:hypothetical protein